MAYVLPENPRRQKSRPGRPGERPAGMDWRVEAIAIGLSAAEADGPKRAAMPGIDRNWLSVELRHLLALHAVAEEGSFRGAALRLMFTQPAISKQIATLEQRVGHRLIERPQGHRPLRLTAAGELLLVRAKNILAQLELAACELNALPEARLGRPA
jgi:molybdenum-dependent DNA-binding transcriptional regulator ModE